MGRSIQLSKGKCGLRSAEIGEQRFRRAKIARLEPLREPGVNVGELPPCLVAPAARREEPRQACRRTQLERLFRAGPRDVDRRAKMRLGRVGVRGRLLEQELA